MRNGRVGVVLRKEGLLSTQSLAHGQLAIDIPLAPIHDANVAVPQWVDVTLQHLARIGPVIHQVELRQHADGAVAV